MHTLEELRAHLNDTIARMTEIDREAVGRALTEDERSEWDALKVEREQTQATITELEERTAYIATLSDNPENREQGAHFHTPRSGVARGDDIYDLTTIRSSFANPHEARAELHDRAKRSIEGATFGDPRIKREDAQEHVERLLAQDTRDGELGRMILTTGSPVYRRAFSKYVKGASMSSDEQKAVSAMSERAFSLGTTGIPIPYYLDPTVVPVSNSVVNPLRSISSVAQVVGVNEWRGVTAAAITAARAAEATEASDNAPTLAQPTIVCSKVQAFVPFSYESGQDWPAMDSELARLFADAKDDEEATAFWSGNGTPPNPFGILTGTTNFSAESTGLTVTAANLYAGEGALPPRFRPRAQWIGNRAIYNIIRALDTAGGAQLWLRIGELLGNAPASSGGNGNTGLRLLGYAVNELSTMPSTVTNAVVNLIIGDFSYFQIVDRVGMTVEFVPQLFGASGRPTGQRGLYAYWRNGSKVLSASAFVGLRGTT